MATLSVEQAIPLLRARVQEQRLIPFIGAGFSVPLGLPSWAQLVEWMAQRLGFDPKLFRVHGDSAQLAEYFDLNAEGNLAALVEYMRQSFHRDDAEARRRASITHTALVKIPLKTIYTTNYDEHIERAFSDANLRCMPIATIADFQKSYHAGTCQVLKFHGTLEEPSSIVISESHYFNRMALETPMDQRLRADILGNTMLFIGYRFSDMNIRNIWYRMHQLRKQSGAQAAARRSYVTVLGSLGLVQERLLSEWGIDIIELNRDRNLVNRQMQQLLTEIAR